MSQLNLESRSSHGFSYYLNQLKLKDQLDNGDLMPSSIEELDNFGIVRELEIKKTFNVSYQKLMAYLKRFILGESESFRSEGLVRYTTYQRLFDLWILRYFSTLDFHDLYVHDQHNTYYWSYSAP